MKIERSCGVLLHITSLPGKFGIGTLGQEAFHFADMLHKAGQQYWQILPIGPVSLSQCYSPYASTSTYAGNYLFVSLEKLKENAWFQQTIDAQEFQEEDFIDFESVVAHKLPLLRAACGDFFRLAAEKAISDYESFCLRAGFWLEDYALFSALADHFNTNHWHKWDKQIALRDPDAIKLWKERLKHGILFHKFVQYLFFKQWNDLKSYCNKLSIKIIGDIPIYITLDSPDIWANPDIFQIDVKSRMPRVVSGVPPDYFSKTGQRWGNPLYRWHDEHKNLNKNTVSWWVQRVRHLIRLMDIVRIDHFRGFESFWSIPAKEKTAVNGKWVKGPGIEFFKQLGTALGDLPLIAEDLGFITPEVVQLRETLGLPGMKILQFAFDHKNKNPYLPHTYTDQNCIVYTGTHDNNTTNGWFYGNEIDDSTRQYAMEYIGTEQFSNFHWQLIKLAYMSVADLVIVPAQDVLGYGAEFRMNVPGTTDNNWRWKLKHNGITEEQIQRLRRMADMYDRVREESEQEGKGVRF